MKDFDRFIEEAAIKRCPSGQYWCYTDKKCKKMPRGYHLGGRGLLEPDEDGGDDGKTNGSNGNGNGNGGNGNGNGGNGNGGNGGGGNGG